MIGSIKPEPFLHRTRKLPCIFAALFVCYSSRSRLRDSLLRPCFDFLLFFTTQTRPVHRETDSGDEKLITPINKIHNPILGYVHYLETPPPPLWVDVLCTQSLIKFLLSPSGCQRSSIPLKGPVRGGCRLELLELLPLCWEWVESFLPLEFFWLPAPKQPRLSLEQTKYGLDKLKNDEIPQFSLSLFQHT